MNLFRRGSAEKGSLTAALLALLEHSDRGLVNGLLRRAEIPATLPPGGEVHGEFPSAEGPPCGLLVAPGLRLSIAALGPGDTLGPDAADRTEGPALVIAAVPRHLPGTQVLTWEQLDRWLAAEAERYDPDSRTGFLIQQFRTYLPEAGVEYFSGFAAELVERAPEGLKQIGAFYGVADQFFDRLVVALGSEWPGTAQARQARADDLLTGYAYRDYTNAEFGETSFLRIALNLGDEELQASLWFFPSAAGPDGHSRLREALLADHSFRSGLQELEGNPLLWLWSVADERKIPLGELTHTALAELPWAQYQAAVQRSLPFQHLAGEGLVERTAALVQGLLDRLSPVRSGPLH